MKKIQFSLGDFIKVTTVNENIEGIFIPSQNQKNISLKLDSGYNISIKKSQIKSTKLLKKHQKQQETPEKITQNKDLPTISILHTGGTIASRVSYDTGAVSAQFSPQDLLKKFPELKKIANITSRLISNTLSENIRFHNYNIIAKEIEKELKNNVKGIIITHGTDTLHYTSAALAFILENIQIPVILVGSQRSSDRPSTDSALNLIHAARFIKETNFKGIAICMHFSPNDNISAILPACKTRKLHTSRRDAFKPINSQPIATIGEKITFLEKPQEPKEKFKLKPIKENIKIGILKTHPHLYAKEIDNYKNFNALILEGTGLGHAPVEKIDSKSSENTNILNTIKRLAKKMPIIMTSQCIFGTVNMNVYSSGRKLTEAGVINNHSDISTETAFIKAAWLLSNHKKEFYTLWNKNLRGELNERILVSQYLE
ncbi:MAG: Glu-tRNA(Gln) amidotransferase subunit GatD [Candidatus Woesearchaeota archaeon]